MAKITFFDQRTSQTPTFPYFLDNFLLGFDTVWTPSLGDGFPVSCRDRLGLERALDPARSQVDTLELHQPSRVISKSKRNKKPKS
eukprot:5444331-Amphidinium_carterae.1